MDGHPRDICKTDLANYLVHICVCALRQKVSVYVVFLQH